MGRVGCKSPVIVLNATKRGSHPFSPNFYHYSPRSHKQATAKPNSQRNSRDKSGYLLCSPLGFPVDIEVPVESAQVCKSPSWAEGMGVCPNSLERSR